MRKGVQSCGAVASLAFAIVCCAGVQGCAADPTHPKSRTVVGENNPKLARDASRRQNWSDAACRWNDLFLRNGPEAHEACLESARALWKLDDRDSAKNTLDAGLERWPNDPDILELQADILCDMGFRRAAEMNYCKALEIDPSRADTWLSLARVRMELGLEAGARTACEKRIELGQGCATTYLLLGQAAAACGDFATAYQSYQRAFDLGNASTEDLVRGAAMYRDARVRKKLAGAADTSRAWLERAIAADPQNTLAHFTLGLIAEDRDRSDEAIAHFRRAIETDPAFQPALVELITLYVRRGDRAAAQSIADHAKQAFEKDSAKCAAIDRALDPPVAEAPKSANGGR
jgi:tetratricopeptide (TPR) repeat protein